MLEYIKGQGWVEAPEAPEITFRCGTVTKVVQRKPEPGEAWDFFKENYPYHTANYWIYVTDYLIDSCWESNDAHKIRVFEKIQ